ncbi:tape measure protein [Kaistella haifensis]|nr:tape measure protein [Kaistella haifensis]
MSGGLGKLGATSQSTFGRMAQHADKMNQRNRILGQSYDQLQSRIREVENTIRTSTITTQIASARRELASLQRQAGTHQGNIGGSGSSSGGIGVGGVALGSMIGNVGLQAATAFLGAVKEGIGSAISGSLQKEKDLVGLSTFIGKKDANVAYKNIRQDAQNSSYDTASLLKANRALISVDGNAKNAREDVMNLANAIAATGGGNDELQRMSINMQQIKSLGKASAMDIRQFGYAGINIYSLLSKATGKSMDEVKEMDVTYDLLAKSLAMARSKGGLYAGALEAQNATKGGRWEAMKDKAANTLTDIGDAMSPIIIQFLDLGTKALNFVAPAILKITPYIDLISKGLGTAIAYITGLSKSTGGWMDYLNIVSGIFGTIWDYSKTVSAQLGKIVGGILEWLGKSLIIKDIFRLIGWTLESIIKPIITWLGDALVWIWEKVLSPILDGLEAAYKWVRDIVTDDNNLTVQATKTIVNKDDPAAPSYQADLTRFKDKGIISDTEAKSKKNKESSKKAGDTISGGGPRVINITLGKFFETIQFTTLNNNESRDELEKLLMEMMGRVLYNGAQNG